MAQDIDIHEEDDQPDIRSLRKAAEAGKKAQDELQQMKRELMFAKAGIDTSSKIGGLLFKTWEGEDIDALKSEAADLGIGPVTQTESRIEIPAEERSQQEFRQTLGRGQSGAVTETPEIDPYDDAYRLFQEARKSGTPMDDAALAAIDRVLVAAASGDKRAIFNPTDWARNAGQVGHRFDK
jgi:hypothetical protein